MPAFPPSPSRRLLRVTLCWEFIPAQKIHTPLVRVLRMTSSLEVFQQADKPFDPPTCISYQLRVRFFPPNMGQQYNKVEKRRRRKNYLQRRKLKARAVGAGGVKPKPKRATKKKAAAAAS